MDKFLSQVGGSVDLDEAVVITQELVRAPSENPPGKERVAADVATTWLDKIGCQRIRTFEEVKGRPNLLAEWGNLDRGPRLIFNGHLDVVPAGKIENWKYPPYSATLENGRLYGRGSSDMKSGIASMIEAVMALKRMKFEPLGHIQFQLVSDEESFGKHGTEYLLRNEMIAGDAAVFGEPTSLMIGLGERGAYWATIHAKGRAAHGSVPEQGVSAIEKIAKVALALHNRRFDRYHPLLGKPSLNVGIIEGGSKINVVADKASISIDRRSIPGETADTIHRELEELLEEIKASDPDCEFEIDVFGFAEPSVVAENAAITTLLASAVESQLGSKPEYFGSPGATDARFLRNQAQIDSVVFGPGIMGAAHTVNEYVDIQNIGMAARIYAELAIRFLSSPLSDASA